jgi:hypothetical protein
MDDNLVPVIIFSLVIGGWILSRLLRHRERMEMLRRGIVPPPNGPRWGRNRAAWTQAPPQAPPSAPGFGYSSYDDPNSAQCTLRRGVLTAMVGFALLIGLSFIGYHGGEGIFSPASIRPGPWLLGGLIPMFVGVAQIIIALMSGAVFMFRMPPPPTGPPGSPPPGQRTYGSAQPGQPGPRYEELARPVPPPDRL